MTEDAVITALYSEDPSCVPMMVAARPNVIWQRPQGNGVAVFFHENPATSNVPLGRELRRLLDEIEPELYEPPVQGEPHAEVGTQEGEAEEVGAPKAGHKKGSSKKGRR